jgi:hypothetical protein
VLQKVSSLSSCRFGRNSLFQVLGQSCQRSEVWL